MKFCYYISLFSLLFIVHISTGQVNDGQSDTQEMSEAGDFQNSGIWANWKEICSKYQNSGILENFEANLVKF